MKFKEIQIIKCGLFGSYKVIAHYCNYFNDHKDKIEKISSFPPRKGDLIWVTDKNTYLEVCLMVRHLSIDYVENKLTIYCR